MRSILLLTELFPWFGHFHPVLVHLPIGFIIVGFILELIGRRKNFEHLLLSVNFVLWLGAFSSLLTVVSGYILSLEGGYGEASVFKHQWSGIALTLLIFATILFKNTKVYVLFLCVTIVGIIITGHLGGNLTHGEGYLTEALPQSIKEILGIRDEDQSEPNVSYEKAKLYKHVVYPILRKKCMSCHNDSKMKGELNMKSFEEFMKGGESGKVMALNDSEHSEMIKRIDLPEENDDTMPPEGKERITDEEMKLIALWIDQDGREETPLDSLNLSDEIKEVIQFRLSQNNKRLNPVFNREISSVSDQTIEILKNSGFTVLAVERGSPFLQINYFNSNKPINEEDIKALTLVREQLVWLDLSGSELEKGNWSFLFKLSNLNKLNLSGTSIGNEVVMRLSEFEFLETLNLFGTNVDRQILESLYGTKNLKYLYLGNTEIRPVDTTAISKRGNAALEVSF